MSKQPPFLPGFYYHVYNRGNNGETLFRQERNYRYFLELYALYIYQIAETFAYCLLPNHFHFLIRIRNLEGLPFQGRHSSDSHPPGTALLTSSGEQLYFPVEQRRSLNKILSQQYATLFGTYTKAINKAFNRTGSLFEKPFHRKLVASDAYFTALIAYIHRNPQNHGIIDDYRDWPYSSYQTLLSDKPSRLERKTVLDWFDGAEGFKDIHRRDVDEKFIDELLFDE